MAVGSGISFGQNFGEWLIFFCGDIEDDQGGGGTPSNGYIAEDGTTFYVAEDGATFYVQES